MAAPAATTVRDDDGPFATLSAALLAFALVVAILVLMRGFVGWLLPDATGRLTLIHSAADGAPGFELIANLIPALFAGAVSILMANRLFLPRVRPPLPLVLLTGALIAALTLAVLLADAALDGDPPLGILALGFGAVIGLLLPAI